MVDSASAYEAHALEFLAARDSSDIGADVIRRWARSLPPATEVFEIACGGGLPVTRTLLKEGLGVWATDSSPTLVETFQSRFPDIPVRCERVQEGDGFGRQFGAVVAIGLIFLLDEADQRALIARAATLLEPGGRFLFTAPLETGSWADRTTGLPSLSLGQDAYEAALCEAGFEGIALYRDAGNGNYYDARLI